MNIDFAALTDEIEGGSLRLKLEEVLTRGFQRMLEAGEPVPPPSHLAARIAEILDRESAENLSKEARFDLYQEVLLACENAMKTVLGEDDEGKPLRI